MAEPARAHLVVQPAVVERGAVTELAVELPRLREGDPPVGLDVEGAQLDVVSSRQEAALGNGESRFTVRVRADGPPGRLPLVLRARFADGRSVDVDTALVVVSAPDDGGLPVAAIAVGVTLALALAAAALVVARRRP